MFSKKRQIQPPFFHPAGGFDPNLMGPGQSPVIPPGGYDIVRLRTEIQENRRLINELLRRVIRLENYLGIRSEFETEDFKSY